MIRCEHFIHALFNGYGIRLKQTSKVDKMLSEQNLRRLYELGNRIRKEQIKYLYFPDEQVISASFLKPVQDEHGRRGSYNHTILVPLNDYFSIAPPADMFADSFIKDLKAPPDTLKPLEVKK